MTPTTSRGTTSSSGSARCGLPVWLACGDDDSFAETNRALADQLPRAVTQFDDGGHDRDYLEAHWPRGAEFLSDTPIAQYPEISESP